MQVFELQPQCGVRALLLRGLLLLAQRLSTGAGDTRRADLRSDTCLEGLQPRAEQLSGLLQRGPCALGITSHRSRSSRAWGALAQFDQVPRQDWVRAACRAASWDQGKAMAPHRPP